MQDNNDRKLKPEESHSGFVFGDEGNDFFRKPGNTSQSASGSETASGDKKRIVIDTNQAKSTYTPQKKKNTWKWIVSFIFVFLLLLAGTYFVWNNLIENPQFLNNGKEVIKKEIKIIASGDKEREITMTESDSDFGLNTDSLVNSLMSKTAGSNDYSETIKRNLGDDTHIIIVNKNGSTITLESNLISKDNVVKEHFLRKIVIDQSASNSKPEIITPKFEDETEKQVIVQKEETKPITQNPVSPKNETPKINKTEKIITSSESTKLNTEKQKSKDTEIKTSKTKDKSEQKYSFEDFGKNEQKNKSKTDISPNPQTPTKEKQYASEGPIYTIQVYSSPKMDDAKFWVRRLQEMNISSAYISEQKIRDVIWYRVRFGEFASKEEAKSAAARYGFGQMWIDRVK